MNAIILVHITYWLNPYAYPKKLEIRLLKEIHFYIFYDGKHDNLFV
jgi:hypothetical protein